MKQNKVSYSKGICWIDDCRIPFVDDSDIPQATTQRDSEDLNHKTKEILGYEKWGVGMELDVKRVPYNQNQVGRFPANILVCDDMLNDGKLSISEGGKTKRNTAHFGAGIFNMEGYGDKGTNSRYYDIDKWFDKILND